MTLLMYVLSLALTFVCSNYEECTNLRSMTYEYIDVTDFENVVVDENVYAVDYRIKETATFIDADNNVTVKEVFYDIPLLSDWQLRGWQDAVSLIAQQRGVDIVEYTESGAIGKVSEERLNAYKDLYKDGFVSDMDSFDYLDERELKEQQTRYTVIFCSFALFYSAVSMVNTVFAYWLKPKKGV